MNRRAPGRALLTTVLLASAGCATTAPFIEPIGAGSGFSYSTGRGVEDFPSTLSVVGPAVLAAMEDLKMDQVRQTRDGAVIRVEARTSDARPVAVTLRFRQGATQVGARIGRFGDEPLSRTLLERVGVRVGTRDPEAIPDAPPSAPSGNPYFSRSAIPDSVMLRDFADAPYHDRVVP
ncbi:DUF3568 family protein [Paludisphaera borealis]|uniref:DUF3568 family protein n=1 Tax=Paludisphaera borealis TaxID=1387353 RepID=A0A1U7CP69_9BACT|nr:DUF3568 family protein [Paludisphaera borealis]APW60708.1 hypothetical protein BSF38_02196 [Paludisphaera borealis]